MYLQIDGLNKSFETKSGTLVVLKDINMNIEQGEFICAVGASGSGKSTLAAALAPSLGRVPGAAILTLAGAVMPWLHTDDHPPEAAGDGAPEGGLAHAGGRAKQKQPVAVRCGQGRQARELVAQFHQDAPQGAGRDQRGFDVHQRGREHAMPLQR